ncbi:aminotransferase class IV [Streptomyces longwoodensis]|uniref:Amc2 n=1 Tax=Streptomyces novoguineensis TaxID=2586640 RepID=A0A4Y5QSG7_9ACTN|nr:Amc2 [Streptomyces novoguineensis]QHW08561.1 branched-chain amino acid aminotransferase [Streptomyces novoguineensis]BBE52678.1 branched chain aminotransferase [Streptomyces sp.]
MSAGYGRLIWRDGVFMPWEEATVHISSVGHASVSAAFEGVHAYWSSTRQTLHGFRLREHMQRLLDSLRMSWLESEFDADALVGATVELLASWQATGKDLHIRPWGFAAGTHRQQMVPRGTPAEIAIETWEFESKLGQGRTCTLAVSSWPRFNPGASPASMKVFSNYHNGRLGTIDARARGADWPVFLNASGHVTESSGACVALVRRGRLITPPLSDGVLDSITRRTVVQLAREELGIDVETRPVERTELYLAEEVFLMGTSAEVLPAVEVDGFPVGDGRTAGEVTRAIESRYHDTVRAVTGDHDAWLTPVHLGRSADVPSPLFPTGPGRARSSA